MATLSSSELDLIRQNCAQKLTINYNKPQVNSVAQAVEDALVSQSASISSAIDTATSPLQLTNAQKKKMIAEVLRAKWERDK